MADLKMPDINSTIIAGNLTRDPTLRTTTNGTPVANFPIAYSRKFKDNSGNWREEVCYVGIVAWYKLAESCHENLTKGSAIMVEGELQSKSWKLDNGSFRNIVEIKAKRIQFLHKKTDVEIIEDIEEDNDTSDGRSDVSESNIDSIAVIDDDSPDESSEKTGKTDSDKDSLNFDNLTF
ncbi:single-stranded DNA-binding protein [candidate division KSB1 bacterium]